MTEIAPDEKPCNDNSQDSNILIQLGSTDDDMVHDALYLISDRLEASESVIDIDILCKLAEVAITNDDGVIDEVSTRVLGSALSKCLGCHQAVFDIAKPYLTDMSPYVRERALHAMGQVALADRGMAPTIRDIAFAAARDQDVGVAVEAQIVIDQISAALFSDTGQPEHVKRLPFFFRSGPRPTS